MKKENKTILSAFLLAGGWGAMLFAVALYLLFWRVDNEPGARDFPILWWGAVTFASLGGLTFVGNHIFLIMKKAWLMLGIGWVLCIALLVGAITLAPLLLLFMV